MADPEAELDALYAGPFEKFVEARNDLAKALKKAGDAAGATAVKALPKPSLAAWAVNQLHRQEPKAFAALLGVADALRGAKGALMQGGDALRAVTKQQREHVDALVGHAKEILSGAGHNASDAVLDKIAHTLRSLAVTGWGDVAPGRLAADLTPPGLDALVDALGGMALPPVDRSKPATPKAAEAKRPETKPAAPAGHATAAKQAETKREAERARREAEQTLAAAELALGRAEREEKKAKENVVAAESAAKRAKEKADAARVEAEEAEHRAEKAEAQVEQAKEELGAAAGVRKEAERVRDEAKKRAKR